MIYVIIFALILADQLTKYIFFNQKILSNIKFFSKHVINQWISWWLQPASNFALFVVNSFILAFVFWLYKNKQIWKISFILITAWWIWNLIDRILFNWVRDFITVFSWFPTFNLADIFLTLWFIFVIVETLKKQDTKK